MLVSAAVAALMLAACGNPPPALGVYPPSGASSIVTTPATGFDVLVTDQDRAVTAHVGQKLEVALRARSGMTDWGNLSASDPGVLKPIPTGITAVRGLTVAGFQAVGAGTTTISATAGPLCSPGAACPAYAALFSVSITVLP